MNYILIRKKRKTISISVNSDSTVLVKAPLRVPKFSIDLFVSSKKDWITHQQSRQNTKISDFPIPILTNDQITLIKKEFLTDMTSLAQDLATKMGVSFSRLSLSSAKSRWGSCSSRGNIRLNWKLSLLPYPLQRYLIIHELAHRIHMNHSNNFWELVQRFDIHYKQHNSQLKQYSHFLSFSYNSVNHLTPLTTP